MSEQLTAAAAAMVADHVNGAAGIVDAILKDVSKRAQSGAYQLDAHHHIFHSIAPNATERKSAWPECAQGVVNRLEALGYRVRVNCWTGQPAYLWCNGS